jgi:flagellar M-ring protein FliF
VVDAPEGLRVLTGEIDEGELPDFADAGARTADPVARLRRLIEERQAETVEILRGWLQDDEERVR